MHIDLSLSLPRDKVSIPVSRHICQASLNNLGVDAETVADIELAVSEACTNVLDHAGPGDEYEISIEIEPEWCVIRITDSGGGFDIESVVGSGDDANSERGRGIQLMRRLVDRVNFVSKPDDGTVVRLEKRLSFADSAPMRRMLSATDADPA